MQCGELELEYEQIMNGSKTSNVVEHCSVMSTSLGTPKCKKCVQCECG